MRKFTKFICTATCFAIGAFNLLQAEDFNDKLEPAQAEQVNTANLTTPSVSEDLSKVPSVSEETDKSDSKGNLYNMGRGLVSIVTSPAEIPRCMVYRNSEVPVFGLVDGFVTGCGMTVLRAFAGVTDVVFLGFDSGLL
ncbi:MAG: hypothetical protein RR060_02930, partial [Victivallaceae bacterium]